MKFYFVRHGESEANILKEISNRGYKHGLTEKGRQQAAELANNLREAQVRHIFCSPLLRAVQTAQILSDTLAIEYDVTDALREFDCGIAESKSDAESWSLHRKVIEDWLIRGIYTARIEQGESFLDVQGRFVPFIEQLIQEQQEQDEAESLILVGHGALFICMLPLVLKNIHSTPIYHFPNTGYVLAETCAGGLVGLEWCGIPLNSD
jgi:broad specificity phosphatase PhoE